MYAPERDEHVKSAAAALGPAASYLCTPEAHGNAPSRPAKVMAKVIGGPRAEGRGQGRLAREAERRKDRGRVNERKRERERKTMKEKRS